MSRKIFVNIAVRDLDKSKSFYRGLGFSLDEQLSDPTSALLVVSEHINVMLMTHDKFRQYAPPGRDVCDNSKQLQALLCLTCENRQEVDELAKRAIAGGAHTFEDPEDHGFMYARSFLDLDGHGWNLVYMDTSAFPPQTQVTKMSSQRRSPA